MTYYGNVTTARRYTGFGTSDFSDSEVEDYLDDATLLFLDEVAVRRVREEVEGSVNGSNKEFELAMPPVADSDFDKEIGTADVMVEYLYNNSYTSLAIASLDPWNGWFELSSAPASGGTVIASYWAYFNPETYVGINTDWSLVDLAVSLLAGQLLIEHEFLFTPSSLGLGSLRFSWTTSSRAISDLRRLNALYLEVLGRIRRGFYSIGETE